MDSFFNKYKQFGTFYIVRALLKRFTSPLYKSTAFLVMAIENHEPKNISSRVKVYDKETISELTGSVIEIPIDLKRQINYFIQNSRVIVYLENSTICGWGFVQMKGLANYGFKTYHLPKETELLKNLYVNPSFRGRSIGKVINKERLNSIQKEVVPTVFVMPENKYAIRNLELYGFKTYLRIKDFLWFNTWHKRKVTTIKKGALAEHIKSGFTNEDK